MKIQNMTNKTIILGLLPVNSFGSTNNAKSSVREYLSINSFGSADKNITDFYIRLKARIINNIGTALENNNMEVKTAKKILCEFDDGTGYVLKVLNSIQQKMYYADQYSRLGCKFGDQDNKIRESFCTDKSYKLHEEAKELGLELVQYIKNSLEVTINFDTLHYYTLNLVPEIHQSCDVVLNYMVVLQ